MCKLITYVHECGHVATESKGLYGQDCDKYHKTGMKCRERDCEKVTEVGPFRNMGLCDPCEDEEERQAKVKAEKEAAAATAEAEAEAKKKNEENTSICTVS